MRALCERLLARARDEGASYAEAVAVRFEAQRVRSDDDGVALHTERGRWVAVRVLAGGDWGYASTTELTEGAADRILHQAIGSAQAAAAISGLDRVPPSIAGTGSWANPIDVDPRSPSLADKIATMSAWRAQALGEPGIVAAHAVLGHRQWEVLMLTSSGADITQTITHTGAGITLGAEDPDGALQVRSFPNGYDGQWVEGGLEVLDLFSIPEAIPPIAAEAVALTQAPVAPTMTGDLIIGGRQAAVQVYETLGRRLSPMHYGRGGALGPDDLGRQVAYEGIDLAADEHLEGGLATMAWDAAGASLSSAGLIDGGRLVSPAAPFLRGWSSSRAPQPRLGNLTVRPGPLELGVMVGTVEDGLYVDTPRAGIVEDASGQFTYRTEVGWRIEGGEVTELVRDPVYSGDVAGIWQQCAGVGDEDTFGVWGLATDEDLDLSVGAPALLFRDVRLGGFQ